MIPRVPHPWSPDDYPYEVLEGTGIAPQSTHDEVLDISMTLQHEGRFPSDVRRAWDRIRTPVARLATDFFLYNPELSDREALVENAWNRFRS